MTNKEAKTNEIFESYQFDQGDDGVTVIDHDSWNKDDVSDFTKVVYVAYRDEPENMDSHKISFHVRFNESSEVDEAYALEMEHGNEVGCRGDVMKV
jgi:hypothetical protein